MATAAVENAVFTAETTPEPEQQQQQQPQKKEPVISPAAGLSHRLFSPHVPAVPPGLKVGIIPDDLRERQRWIRPVRVENPTARLICFSNFGSSAAVYHNWHKIIAEDIEVMPLESPGLGALRSIEPYHDINDLENSITPTCYEKKWGLQDRPMLAYGQCMQGAFCANVMVDLVKRKFNLTPLHLFIGAAIPPHYPVPNLAEPETLKQVFKLPKALTEKYPLMFKLAINQFSDYLQQGEMIKNPHSVPITVFRGKKDPFVSEEQCRAWSKYTTSDFEYHEVPDANHIFQHKDDSAQFVLDIVNAKISVLHKHKPTVEALGKAFGFPVRPAEPAAPRTNSPITPMSLVRFGVGEDFNR